MYPIQNFEPSLKRIKNKKELLLPLQRKRTLSEVVAKSNEKERQEDTDVRKLSNKS